MKPIRIAFILLLLLGVGLFVFLFSRHSYGGSQAAEGISIREPPNLSRVISGQIIRVVAEPVGGISIVSALVVTPFGVKSFSNGTLNLSLQIAREAVGQITLIVDGKDSRGRIFSDEVTLIAQPSASLLSLDVDPSSFHFFRSGAHTQLTVKGLYSDDVARDLTKALTGTTYISSDSGVVTVDSNGDIVSRGNGVATVQVSNSGVSTNVSLIVKGA